MSSHNYEQIGGKRLSQLKLLVNFR
jgi:hypothetical protein